MGAETIVIGQIFVGVLQAFILHMKAAGVSAEEIDKAITELRNKVIQSKPEFLPDV